MAKSIFKHAKVLGISAVVPQKEISLMDELQYFDGNAKKAERVTKMAGINKRRLADTGVTASDLCYSAAETLLTEMSIDRQSIDAIIFISQTPDYKLPATSGILQNRLGLPKTCAAFDVNQGCTAFLYGLWLGSSLLESGAAKRLLVMVGESATGIFDPDNRVITPVFGDSGTATLMEYSEEETPSWFVLGTDGSGYESLIIPVGQARIPFSNLDTEYAAPFDVVKDTHNTPWRLHHTYMDGGAIFSFSTDVVPKHIKELLDFSGHTPNSIENLILHQANKQIIMTIAEKSGFPLEKAPAETFSKYGNQSGASIPGVLCDLFAQRLSQGPFPALLSSFGVGLSWASCVMTFNNVWCSGIREYVTPENHPTPDTLAQYWRNKLASQ